MTKTPIWNKETEEFLIKVLGMGATSAQASQELYDKFDMVFTRNSIISKAKRLRIEFIRGGKKKYSEECINYVHAWKRRKIDASDFIKAWNDNMPFYEMEKTFGIKVRSVIERARRLKLKPRQYKPGLEVKRKSFSYKGDGTKENPKKFERVTFPNPEARKLKFIDVQRNQCRFIIGDGLPSDYVFCGADVHPDSPVPYCKVCKPIVYVKPRTTFGSIEKLFR